jgi:DNA-directed RNA polymerase specialized sigma24 family protein
VHEHSDEELLVAIAAGPGFLPEFYRRHVAKVTGVGVRRFSTAEDVADFVANVFLEVLRSAGSYDPRRGDAVAWLYGLAGNVAAGMRRRQRRSTDAEHRLAGRSLLELVAVDGLSTGEAANTLGITGVATRVRLVRARARLRARLDAADQPLPTSQSLVKEERA